LRIPPRPIGLSVIAFIALLTLVTLPLLLQPTASAAPPQAQVSSQRILRTSARGGTVIPETDGPTMTGTDLLHALDLGDPPETVIARIRRNHTNFKNLDVLFAGLHARESQANASALAQIWQEVSSSVWRKGAPLDVQQAGTHPQAPTAAASASTPETPAAPVHLQAPAAIPSGQQPATAPAQAPAVAATIASPAPQFSPETERARTAAVAANLDVSPLNNPQQAGSPACDAKDKRCVTLDWGQKSASTTRLRANGEIHFHIVNLNDILYDYSVSGDTPQISTNDLQLIGQLVQDVQKNLLQANPQVAHATTCRLLDPLSATTAPLAAISTAVASLQPQLLSKQFASAPLSESLQKAAALAAAFSELRQLIGEIQKELRSPQNCSDAQVAAAAQLVANYAAIRSQVDAIDQRAHRPHTRDYYYYCDETVGCNVTVTESLNGTLTNATPNPWKTEFQPTLSQLTLSGGFLLTTLQARSYSSRTAPDPAAPTTKTINVLGVDYGSGVRPALTALLNYHIPYVDWPRGGLALSAGPVIDVSSGKADTSKFGFFGGVSFHLWNRFWITPGVHVGEFADVPQGFKGAGDIIPPNTGTPVPVKRYTARFAIAITFKGGNPAALVSDNKNATPANSAPSTPPPASGAAKP
jgi:hypothetical protein